MRYNNLSEFLKKTEVRRVVNKAEIIVAYQKRRPIRLIGFLTDSSGKTDFTIKEEGYTYYKRLVEICG